MRRGFTLIELLVVIAIIAILAAILFPVFARARVTAITTKCCSHGRELGIAMMMYMDDNSGRFPTSVTAGTLARFTHITWRYRWPPYPADRSDVWGVGGQNQFAYIQLAQYVKNTAIWQCPQPQDWYAMKYAYGFRCSWFFVVDCDFGDFPDTTFQDNSRIGRTVAEVLAKDLGDYKRYVTPSRKIWAYCAANGDLYQIEAYRGGPVITPSYPHGEGSIYVYVDGHARYRETGCGWSPVGYTGKNCRCDMPHKRRR